VFFYQQEKISIIIGLGRLQALSNLSPQDRFSSSQGQGQFTIAQSKPSEV